MRPFDWLVFAGFAAYVVWDGVRRNRGRKSAEDFLLAGRNVPWWAMGLSVMATQASAITLVSTVGRGCRAGTGFAQFYYFLPLAMLILCFTAVPLFHRLRVYTAYEYLERRFDRKTRTACALTFLVLRALSAGIVIYAPAVVMNVMFGLPLAAAVILIGAVAVIYTAWGGLAAVIFTDVKQMVIMVVGLAAVFAAVIQHLPSEVGLADACSIAETLGRFELLDLRFDPTDRYNIWSALLGGTFLFLAYFGTDQSQVQRYLAGRSLRDKRLALGLSALLKVPFQIGVLTIGVLISVLFLYEPGPITFQPDHRNRGNEEIAGHLGIESAHQDALRRAGDAATAMVRAASPDERAERSRELRRQVDLAESLRGEGARLRAEHGLLQPTDSDFILPWFARRYLPAGLLGLLVAAIFAAVLSSLDSEFNSMATVTVNDILRLDPTDPQGAPHLIRVTRGATVALGALATGFALGAGHLEAVIEYVNIVGSFFYGSLLGVFVLGGADRRAHGTGAVVGLVCGIAAAALVYVGLGGAFLWMNTSSVLVTLVVGSVASRLLPRSPKRAVT